MKMHVVWILTLLTLALSACSDSKTGDGAKSGSAEPQAQAVKQAQVPASMPSAPGKPPMNGKVVKAMHAGGYTYMQVENQGKQFWVAAKMMNVKRNDQVAWSDAAVMKNFTSSTLRRTFDEILFVSSAKVM